MKKIDFKYCKKSITAAHRLEIHKTITGKYELWAYDPLGWMIFIVYKGKSKLKAELLKGYSWEHVQELRRKIDWE